MKKLIILCLVIIITNSTTMTKADAVETNNCTWDGNEAVKNNKALIWYRTAAGNKAIFRQIFNLALNQINEVITEQKLKAQKWGVIFALDGTLLDITGYQLNRLLKCNNNSQPVTLSSFYTNNQLPATPGAADITCSIQNMGGRVIIITTRVGSGEPGQNLVNATKNNLSGQKICYDSIIFANDSYDHDKNPRFAAVSSGDYENVITTKYFDALSIIAYIGSDIQDFPDYKQNTTQNLPDTSPEWDKFGDKYFILPNPLFGSWQNNYLK